MDARASYGFIKAVPIQSQVEEGLGDGVGDGVAARRAQDQKMLLTEQRKGGSHGADGALASRWGVDPD